MPVRVAINGYGRIGRNVLRALYEANRTDEIQIVAINDLGDMAPHVYLTKYDTTHGRFNAEVRAEGNELIVNGDRIKVLSERDPEKLPWGELDIDVVYESTGRFTARDKAELHLKAGAKKVLIAAPGKNADITVVYGVNHDQLKPEHRIVSNASCTTNCLAPVAKVLNDAVGIDNGLITTIHAYTNDQVLIDTYHTELRRARAAAMSMIPTKTGAAIAVGLVLPELSGKLDGYAMRVPTLNVSMVDLAFISKRQTSVEEINAVMKEAAEGPLKSVLAYTNEPLVSIDFNHCPASSTFDGTLTKVYGNLVKIGSWYDNEWGFSNRMLDVTLAMVNAK